METKSKPQKKKQKKLLTSLDFVLFIVIEFHEFKVGPLITNSNKWNVPYFPINQDYSVSLVYPYSVGFLGIPLPTSSVLKSDDLPKNIFVQNFESCRAMVPSIRPYSPRNPLRPFRPKYEKAAATLPPVGRRN